MPLPGFPYATIVGFGVLVIAAGLLMLFANQQQEPVGYGNTRRRRSPSPPPNNGTEQKRRTSDPTQRKVNGGYECIICLDCENLCRFVKLYCGHQFHSNCLTKWFEASQKGKVCPTCSAVVTSR